MRHRTIILVNIIYFDCIIATTIIAMIYYNYQILHPHRVCSSTTDYYTTTTTNTATYYYPLNRPHFSSLHMTYFQQHNNTGTQYYIIKCK
jgi:hypothetical protein